jgi:hypothetical protein
MSGDELYDAIRNNLEFIVLKDVVITPIPGRFIPRSHQVFPRRYFISFPQQDIILLDYEMGTGKTFSAIYTIQHFLKLIDQYKSIGNPDRIILPKPYIIGSWASIQAFERELLDPNIGFITQEQLENSTEKELSVFIESRIKMITYQKFFNKIFEGAYDIPHKTEEIIKQALESGKIILSDNIISELNDSIIVIDEFQNLYSIDGLNTYGLTIEYIRQSNLIKNMKMICLSGTFLSSDIREIISLVNIIRPKGTKRLDMDSYIVKKISWTIKKSKLDDIIKYFDGIVAIYRQPITDEFPEVIMMGKLFKRKNIEFATIKTVECFASEYQWNAILNTKKSEIEEFDPMIITSEIYIPPNMKQSTYYEGTVTGDEFKMPSLKKYSTILGNFLEVIFDVIKNDRGEKIAAHHRRTKQIGVYQIAQIFRDNDFIDIDDLPNKNTLCVHCGKSMGIHTNKIHEYHPVKYVLMTGDMNEKHRKIILDRFNDPLNINGVDILIVLTSSIAELGLTFSDINHVCSLGLFPNFMIMRQYLKRFARRNSHRNNPKKWVKFYLFVLSHKNEVSDYIMRYYEKEVADIEITTRWKQIEERSINCFLHGEKCKYIGEKRKKFDRRKYDLFYADLEVKTVSDCVIHYLNIVNPIVSVLDIRKFIIDDKSHISPWSTKYTSNESIEMGIWELYNSQKISLYSQITDLSTSDLLSDNIYITKYSSQDFPLYNLFMQIPMDLTITRIPLMKEQENIIEKLYEKFKSKSNDREMMEIIGSMLLYLDNFIKLTKEDFIKRGPIFEYLLLFDAIVFKGDMDGKFVENRIKKFKSVEEIGFIIGPIAYIHENGTWREKRLPIDNILIKNENEYCSIFSVGSAQKRGKWIPRFRIRQAITDPKNKRNVPQGLACKSIDKDDIVKIYKYLFGELPENDYRDLICEKMRNRFLEIAMETKDKRVIYNYYEAPKLE